MGLPGITSLKQKSNIIPFPKQPKRGGLENLKEKKPEIDKQSWIKQKIQQNKDAIENFILI